MAGGERNMPRPVEPDPANTGGGRVGIPPKPNGGNPFLALITNGATAHGRHRFPPRQERRHPHRRDHRPDPRQPQDPPPDPDPHPPPPPDAPRRPRPPPRPAPPPPP